MRHTIKISIALIGLAFASCQAPDIISLPKGDPKLVINCISFNEGPWRARVSASQDVLQLSNYTSIADASVTIYENGVFVESLSPGSQDSFDSYGALYEGSADVTPIPGKTYKVTVAHPAYPAIESEFQQPQAVEPATFEIQVLGPNAIHPEQTDLQWRVEFTDPPGEDFYEIIADAYFNEGPNYTISIGLVPQFIDPAYQENNELWYQTQAFDDTYLNGKTVALDFVSTIPNEYIGKVEEITLYFRHLSKEYYQYMKTTNLQRKAFGDAFAQPVLIENNIINGYGIFGGFTQTRKKTTLSN